MQCHWQITHRLLIHWSALRQALVLRWQKQPMSSRRSWDTHTRTHTRMALRKPKHMQLLVMQTPMAMHKFMRI